MNNLCDDNRFEVIKKAKEYLLEATNIDTSADEMACLDSFLFRCWQVGWIDRFDETKVEPRNHGHWKLMDKNNGKCSVCGYLRSTNGSDLTGKVLIHKALCNYCEKCGAKMDGNGESDENL